MYIILYIIFDSHMAPGDACEVTQSIARSPAEFKAERRPEEKEEEEQEEQEAKSEKGGREIKRPSKWPVEMAQAPMF